MVAKIQTEEFKKFIEFKDCSFEEFQKAKKYLEEANESEKKDFTLTCFLIVRQVMRLITSKKELDITIGRVIYEAHGLTYEDFMYYFNLYKNKYMPSREKIKYLESRRNILSEKIWQEAKNGMWQKEEIRKTAKSYGLTIDQTEKMINFYFEHTLKFNKETIRSYKKCYKRYRLFIELKLSNTNDFKYAYNYYCEYANYKEKEVFKVIALQILANVKKYISNLTPYLESINLNLYSIYIISTIFQPDFTIEIIKLFKPFYDFCDSNNWKVSIIEVQAREQNVPFQEFREMAKIYGVKVLGITNIDELIKNAQNSEIRSNFALAPIIERILNSDNSDEYFILFEKYSIRKKEIWRFCYTYNRELDEATKEAMEQNLIQKLAKFQKEYLVATPNNQKYNNILNEFLNSNYTLEEFCQINNYNIKSFKNALSNCKDKTLIEKIQNRLDLEKNNREKQKEESIIELVDCIKKGIIINNVHYNFDFTSFFIFFPNINYKTIKTGSLPKEDAQIIRRFFLPLKEMRIIGKDIINARISRQINDGENIYIKEFTKDELVEIINFMEQYNIPLTDVLFHEICLNYATGKLSIYRDNSLGLK